MNAEREIIEVKKVNCKLVTFYKCSYPICDAKTANVFCRHHSVKYSQCKYDNCVRNCRPPQEFCYNHLPARLESKRKYMRDRARQ